jgi:hypothetical protein
MPALRLVSAEWRWRAAFMVLAAAFLGWRAPSAKCRLNTRQPHCRWLS